MVSRVFNISELNGFNGFVINGIDLNDFLGVSVSDAGDVNGDGIDDIIIGALGSDPNGNSLAGESYVVFGNQQGFTPTIDLSNLDGTNGFIINGIDGDDRLGTSVGAAGDINGDGIDDIVIGAPDADPYGISFAGEIYVVFGNQQGFTPTLNLSDLNGANGFTINGVDSLDRAGTSVGAAGDINGDGIDDIVIGAPFADPYGISSAGETYVVFGNQQGFTPTLNLSDLNGANGFIINGIDGVGGLENAFLGDQSGTSVGSAGDINGDGIDDLITGAPFGDYGAGQSYIIFGKTSDFTPRLNLSDLNGDNGFIVNGVTRGTVQRRTGIIIGERFDFVGGDRLGDGVSAAGDFNNDDIDDVIIGVSGISQSIVVFGSSLGFPPILSLSDINGTNGFVFDFSSVSDLDVSNAGDFNGDGIDDVIIGATISTIPLRTGESYVVFGSDSNFPTNFSVSDLNGINGFIISIDTDDLLQVRVSAAGDVNNDGFDDLIIGSNTFSRNAVAEESYIVFGNASPTLDLNGANPGIDFTTSFNGSPVPIVDTANLSISDINSSSLSGATITITNSLERGAEILSANTEGTSISANYNQGGGTLTLTGRDTIANYERVLQSITYAINTSILSEDRLRIIEFFVNDGQANGISPVAITTLSLDTNISFIEGTLGRDTLSGTPVHDIIAGFQGADTLSGGGGDDIFVYNSIRDAGDTITDFEVGADVILLSRSLFQPLPNLNYDIATNDGFLGFRTQGSDTTILIDPDGTGGNALLTPLSTVRGVAVSDLASANNFVL
jgi:hypothetical protein